jgi:hypothetical protein
MYQYARKQQGTKQQGDKAGGEALVWSRSPKMISLTSI